jgi:hypothetical protein
MFDFILGIVRHSSGYQLCAESPFLAGQARPVPFDVKEAVRWRAEVRSLIRHVYSEPPERGDEKDYLPLPMDSVQIGKDLYAQVFSGEVEDLFLRALKLAREERSGLRILIKAWHSPEIHDLPWELLHDGRRFLAQSTETPVVRYLEQRRPLREFRIAPPLRLLLTTACPVGVDPLDIQEEERRLKAALAPLGDRATIVVEREVGLERLRHILFRARSQGRPFQVWHHAGHGGLESEKFSLALASRDGILQEVTVADLEEVLAPCEELRLAVLNVCEGASATGLATALANLSIPAVIGFREPVLDTSALVFAEAFYQELVETTLERAMSRARLELRDAGYSPLDWSYPLLFAHTSAAGPWL